MQDGIGQVGAGASDMRLAGEDLQHNRQTRTADEYHEPVRIVRRAYQDGGPMHMRLADYLEMERKQHGM